MATKRALVRQSDGSYKWETMVDLDGVIDMLHNSPTANTKELRQFAKWLRDQDLATEEQYTLLMQEADRHDGINLS